MSRGMSRGRFPKYPHGSFLRKQSGVGCSDGLMAKLGGASLRGP